MKLTAFIVRRLIYSLFVLLGLSIFIFVLSRVVPGDPVRMSVSPRTPEDVVQKLRQSMHLDKPIYVQYMYWLQGVVHGDFGLSLTTQLPVSNDIATFFPATLELILCAGVLDAAIGIPLGTLAGRYKDQWVDNLVRVISYLGVVTPSFVFAIIFQLIFGYALKLIPTVGQLSNGLTPPPHITGMIILDALLNRDTQDFWDALEHVLLPAVALALPAIAQQARITRSTISDNLGKEYIVAERALGVPNRVIMSSFLLKPSLTPSIAILGLDFASMAVNAFLVEMIFNWPGLSRYGITVMLHKDLNAIAAVVLVFGCIFTLVNIMVDVIVAELDPRIRLSAARSE